MRTLFFASLMIAMSLLIHYTESKCAYTQPDIGLPYPFDGEAFPINYTMQACKDYIGGDVCCNEANARLTNDNFKQLDAALGTLAGGCDICSINMKRMWCQYACSPRQADFLTVSTEYYDYPDPQKPGKMLRAQQANLTVETSTACALFQACRRVPFVASVSAMGSPAGFLNFQGHNAIDNALQFISVQFTYDPTKGLYLNDASGREATASPASCDYKGAFLHQFKVEEPCICNTCEQACSGDKGFEYSEPSIFEGFNYALVGGFYGGVAIVTGALTYYRHRREKLKIR